MNMNQHEPAGLTNHTFKREESEDGEKYTRIDDYKIQKGINYSVVMIWQYIDKNVQKSVAN